MKTIITMLNKCCNRETITYIICGLFTTVVGIGVFWLCDKLGLRVAVSNTFSVIIAVLFAYLGNKIFVFRFVSWRIKTLAKEIAAFLIGQFGVYLMETVTLVVLVEIMLMPPVICKAFVSVLVVAANYIISKKAVFL